jgi:hypothetical protein
VSADFDHPDQNFLAHDKRRKVESAICVWLILVDLRVKIRLHKEVRVELSDRWDNQMSKEFSWFVGRHHPTKGSFILAA